MLLLYILVIAVLNLSLGFALAVHLSRRCPQTVVRSPVLAQPPRSFRALEAPPAPATDDEHAGPEPVVAAGAAVEAAEPDGAAESPAPAPGADAAADATAAPAPAPVVAASQVELSLSDMKDRVDECLRRPDRCGPLALGMIDVDQLGQLNECHGRAVADQVLARLGQIVRAECRGESLVARFSAQRFCLLFSGSDLRQATNAVERIRQTIGLTCLERADGEIRATVSGAVTEAAAEDTAESLYARAETTLREAKRYGRNRTFIHEGKYPTPVVPPNLALEENRLPL